MSSIHQAVEPIYEIIVLTQNQDIIRQNMENLIKIFETTLDEVIDKGSNDSESEVMMDKLLFVLEVINLTQRLMDNILEAKNLKKWFPVRRSIKQIIKRLRDDMV